jgi:hypothetical protein
MANPTALAAGDFVRVRVATSRGRTGERDIKIDDLMAAIPVPVGMTKPRNLSAGASTAAAGTTTADAGVLPAAAAPFYPTTAADGTKGVRLHASDAVTGQLVIVGNAAAAVLKIYPQSGGKVNNGSADAAFSTGSGKGAILYCYDGTNKLWLAF